MTFTALQELTTYYLAVALATINSYDDYRAELTSADSLHVRDYKEVIYQDGWYEAFITPSALIPLDRLVSSLDESLTAQDTHSVWIKCDTGVSRCGLTNWQLAEQGTVEVGKNGNVIDRSFMFHWLPPKSRSEFLYNVHTGDIKPLEDPSVSFEKRVWTEPMRVDVW